MTQEKRTIRVYNKKNELVAIFTNENATTAKSDLMINPTVTIVSNGESTLSFQMLADSQKWHDIKDPESIYECGGRYYTALNTNSVVYSDEEGENVVNVTLVETWYLLKKVYVQAHNVNKKVEALDEHTVKILPKSKKEFKLTVNGKVYEDSEVRDSRGVLMPRGSAGYALWAILKGTDWNLGICDVLPVGFDAATDYGTFNVETDMKSALENIQFIQSLYGGILDWDSKNKTVSLRDETNEKSDFNTWKGYEARKGKNLVSAPEIVWDNNIITRLYPLGNGNLNIKAANNGKTYIENFSYTKDVYEGYIQNPNIYYVKGDSGQKLLKRWAEKELEKMCRPRKSINYELIDLRATKEYAHETFDVNDIIKAYYIDTETGKETYEFLRIQSISYDYFHPASDSTIEVGDKIINETQLFKQIWYNAENSAPTDKNGNLSGDNLTISIPNGWGDGYTTANGFAEIIAEKHTENIDSIAGLRTYADETFATVESFTSFQKRTENKFAESSTYIGQVSSELEAQITLEAQHYEETSKGISEAIASISTVASDLSSQITLETRHYEETSKGISNNSTKIDQVSDSLGSRISNIVTSQNKQNSNFSQSISEISQVANAAKAAATMSAYYYDGKRHETAASLVKAMADNEKAEVKLSVKSGSTTGEFVLTATKNGSVQATFKGVNSVYVKDLFGENGKFSGKLEAAKGSFKGEINWGDYSGRIYKGSYGPTIYATNRITLNTNRLDLLINNLTVFNGQYTAAKNTYFQDRTGRVIQVRHGLIVN